MKRTKMKARQAVAKQWFDKIATPAGYKISNEELGFNRDEVIQGLSYKELTLLNQAIVAAYHTGCNDTRQWYSEYRKSQDQS